MYMVRTRKFRNKSFNRLSGWKKIAPMGKARTRMLRKCGRRCFLGSKGTFPICAKGTCKINKKGLSAAYIRSKQWGKKRSTYKGRSKPRLRRRTYRRIYKNAKKMLNFFKS